MKQYIIENTKQNFENIKKIFSNELGKYPQILEKFVETDPLILLYRVFINHKLTYIPKTIKAREMEITSGHIINGELTPEKLEELVKQLAVEVPLEKI